MSFVKFHVFQIKLHSIFILIAELNVRLVNGTGSCSGRVEVYYKGQWGTVCDDGWDINDADVVCRQMGCGGALSVHSSAHFGKGTGLIILDNIYCFGNESSLTECRHSGIGNHDCNHGEDAGVACSGEEHCSILGYIRLVNGTGFCNGRVEIYHDGQWGTVCDDGWDINDADVVCRQMGCGRALNTTHSAHFGEGNGPVLLDDVECAGHESHLISCSHKEVGKINCSHSEDAGVICSGKIPFLVSVRLLNGTGSCSGRVEVYYKDQWGTVCDDDWDINDADVVCRQMGCGRAVGVHSNDYFGQGTRAVIKDVRCYGTERFIEACSSDGFPKYSCNHAGVTCSEIRLVNGTGNCDGRVEIYHDGQWGTVCGDNWDMKDAEVVCRQVECGRALNSTHSAHFGEGNGPVLLDDVGCSGQENNLLSCSHGGLGITNCSHSEDAGVVCSGKNIESFKSFLCLDYTSNYRF
uniref:SRCR domain-containing protein n=1 Tax=Astyanax mexicanus TaxID=7994 RepID=A0A3B1KJ65_ASTMX